MKKEIRIGRHSENDIVINDPCVGRSVLAIMVDDDGESYAEDLKSKDGVYINNKRIYGRVKLHPDDVVRIGNTTLPWKEYIKGIAKNMDYGFKLCVNGHYYKGDKCPYCNVVNTKPLEIEYNVCPQKHIYDSKKLQCEYCADKRIIRTIKLQSMRTMPQQRCLKLYFNSTKEVLIDGRVVSNTHILEVSCSQERGQVYRSDYHIYGISIKSDSEVIIGEKIFSGKEFIKFFDFMLDNTEFSVNK